MKLNLVFKFFFNSHDNTSDRRVPNYVPKEALGIRVTYFIQQEFSTCFFVKPSMFYLLTSQAAFRLGEVMRLT